MTALTGPRLDDAGTPEGVWRRSPFLGELPLLDGRPPNRAVIVTPHPDDEILGCGGLMRRLSRAGTQLVVVAVTAGEASHPWSPTVSPAQLAVRRAAEAARSYTLLGVALHRVELGVPDGRAVEAVDRIAASICRFLRPSDWCVAPWSSDGHPDHDATGRAAAEACGRAGSQLLSYLVWTWHWSHPADPRVPWERARRVSLSPADRRRKDRAVQAFQSQVRPLSAHPADSAILTDLELSHHRRPFEVVLC